MANVTDSGIQIRKWVERAVVLLRHEAHEGAGPAICERDGSPVSSVAVDEFFKMQTQKVQNQKPDLIDPKVNVWEDFGIFRSFRKGSESRATEAGVSAREIDLVNRWRKNKHSMPMRDYYLDMLLVKSRYLRYSKSL